MTGVAQADVIWVMRLEFDEAKQLLPHQKANWIPGMPEMCWKHLLHSNVQAQKLRFGEAPFSFWPRGWNLPEDYAGLKAFYDSETESNDRPIILKPSMAACGNGIRCITNIAQLPPDDPFLTIKSVAQHYVPRPLLLDGYKVTFRIYVLVTSYAPLRAYIFPNGLGRICSHRYTEELSSFDNLFAHLTNYDINKHNMDDFLQSRTSSLEEDGLATDGLRTDFLSVMAYLKRQGKDTDALWQRMKETTALTLLATDKKISSVATNVVKFHGTTFEILGFDFLIDEDTNPWILEVNHGPNLEPHTELETDLKRSMLREALHLVDLRNDEAANITGLAESLFRAAQALKEANKSIDDRLTFSDSEGAVHHFPLSTLSRLEFWTLVESEKELTRAASWEPVFPTSDADQKYSLPLLDSGELISLYSEGFGGRRNSLLVNLLQLGLTLDTILQMAEETLQQS